MNLQQPGIVLRVTQLQEADLSVVLLCQELGKIRAMARSAKKSKKRFFGGIDVFDAGTFEIYSSTRSGSFRLDSLENRVSWPNLRTDLKKMTLASFCLEIADRLTMEEDPEGGALFLPLYYSLKTIDAGTQDEGAATGVFFALKVLELSGLDILHSEWSLTLTAREWLSEMRKLNKPVLPHERQAIRDGFGAVLPYLQHVTEHRLNTGESLKKLFLKFEQP